MKIKNDFITNSSSACFIMALPESRLPSFHEFIDHLNQNPEYANEGVRTYNKWKSLKELQEYVNDHPYDWASYPMGLQFINMDEKTYNKCKDFFDECDSGVVVLEVWVDYQACEEFCDKYKDCIIEELS